MSKIDKQLPADPERFERWRKRLTEAADEGQRLVNAVPTAVVFSVWPMLRAYYGSYPRALWSCARFQLFLWLAGLRVDLLMGISDLVGWTWRGYNGLRHGRGCEGDCAGGLELDCIDKELPRWFRKLVGGFDP